MTHPNSSLPVGKTPTQPLSDRLTVDASRCAGCRDCEMVCSLVHEGWIVPALARLSVFHDLFADDHPTVVVCRQCRDPACMAACARDAIAIDEWTAARVVDPSACDGCGLCVEACPHEMIWLHPATQVAYTCDLCGGRPRCVDACPQGAIVYEHRGTRRPGVEQHHGRGLGAS